MPGARSSPVSTEQESFSNWFRLDSVCRQLRKSAPRSLRFQGTTKGVPIFFIVDASPQRGQTLVVEQGSGKSP
jgi:hypothetical protein